MMDTELLQALGAEVAQHLSQMRVEIRREVAEAVDAVQRSAAADLAALRERLADTTHALELARAGLATVHAAVADPVAAFTLDASGTLQLVQRNGESRRVVLPDVAAMVRAAVDAMGASIREALAAEAHADIARTFELFCNAPAWSATAVYAEGQIVQTDVGRTYRVRKGIRATIGRTPGDDAEHWERLGTGGFRVFKSKPEALAPGDVFTERDARFMHDGQSTILFVPAAAKVSDIERAIKAPHGLAQATQAQLRDLAGRVSELLEGVQRNAVAANDASEVGLQALELMAHVREDLDAMQRRLDELAAAGASS